MQIAMCNPVIILQVVTEVVYTLIFTVMSLLKATTELPQSIKEELERKNKLLLKNSLAFEKFNGTYSLTKATQEKRNHVLNAP